MSVSVPGLWMMRVVGRYVRPDGTPHKGHVVLTPPAVTAMATGTGGPFGVVAGSARLDLDHHGYIAAEVLNPNDPTISPGPCSGNTWPYYVREVLQGSHEIGWWLHVPPVIVQNDVLDLSKVERVGEDVVRPADWFPYHLTQTPVQASRISPRSGF